MTVVVLSPGMNTTVQDLGRYRFRAYGMPVAGALDRYSLMAGNLVAGNGPGAAALEITFSGPEVRFGSDRLVCITGGDLAPRLNGDPFPCWEGGFVRKGDVLSFSGPCSRGIRAWLCISGGVNTQPVMGSRSTYLRGGLGGMEGRRLRAGDILSLGLPDPLWARGEGFSVPGELRTVHSADPVIRVLPGPQEGAFTSAGLDVFYGSSFRVGAESDRMGCRLEGPAISHCGSPDIVSDAVPEGSIQVPGNGLPIIMLSDSQTTGGYTKIACAVNADLHLLAQLAPGDTLSFRKCGIREAAEASAKLKQGLARIRVLLADHRSRSKGNIQFLHQDSGSMKIRFCGKSYDVRWEREK